MIHFALRSKYVELGMMMKFDDDDDVGLSIWVAAAAHLSTTNCPMVSATSPGSPFSSTISARTTSQGSLSSLSIALQHKCYVTYVTFSAQVTPGGYTHLEPTKPGYGVKAGVPKW